MHVRVSISHNQVWQRRKKNDCIQSTWASAALQVREPGETPRKDKQSTLPVFPLNAIFGHFKNISVPLLKLLSKEIFACFVFCPIEIGIYERIWYVCLKKCFLIRCERVELLNFAPKMSKFIGFEVKHLANSMPALEMTIFSIEKKNLRTMKQIHYRNKNDHPPHYQRVTLFLPLFELL